MLIFTGITLYLFFFPSIIPERFTKIILTIIVVSWFVELLIAIKIFKYFDKKFDEIELRSKLNYENNLTKKEIKS
jgi:sensor histidine kinase YesM